MVAAILIFSVEALIKMALVSNNLVFYAENSLKLYKLIDFAQLWLFIMVLLEIIIIAVVESLARQKIEKIDLNNDEGIKEKAKLVKQRKEGRAFLVFVVLTTILFRVVLTSAKLEVLINDHNNIIDEDEYIEYLQN